jgi:hypothetical protein
LYLSPKQSQRGLDAGIFVDVGVGYVVALVVVGREVGRDVARVVVGEDVGEEVC